MKQNEKFYMYRVGSIFNINIEKREVLSRGSNIVHAVIDDGEQQAVVIEPATSQWCNYFETWDEAHQFLYDAARRNKATYQARVADAEKRLQELEELKKIEHGSGVK